MADVTVRIEKWMTFYNHRRKHQTLDYEVPGATIALSQQEKIEKH